MFTSKGYLKRYEGDFNVGRRQGHGVAYFENGDKYDGEFKDNVVSITQEQMFDLDLTNFT